MTTIGALSQNTHRVNVQLNFNSATSRVLFPQLNSCNQVPTLSRTVTYLGTYYFAFNIGYIAAGSTKYSGTVSSRIHSAQQSNRMFLFSIKCSLLKEYSTDKLKGLLMKEDNFSLQACKYLISDSRNRCLKKVLCNQERYLRNIPKFLKAKKKMSCSNGKLLQEISLFVEIKALDKNQVNLARVKIWFGHFLDLPQNVTEIKVTSFKLSYGFFLRQSRS